MICLGTRGQSGLHHPVSVYAIQTRGVEAGKPIELEPWQVFDLGCTYGWVHRDTGARRFTRTYNKRARGNYKSTEKSAQGLYHMCADAIYPPYRPELAAFEQEPEVECAAVDRGHGKRVQSLLDVITTAGDDAQSKPCFVEETYAKRVLEDPTVTDDRYFVMVRELDEGDNPHDEEKWRKANPCLRYPSAYSAILLRQIQDEHSAAYTSNDPGKIRKFLTRRLCLWQTGSENRYLDEHCMALAKRAMVPAAEFAALTDGQACHCGFDLGKRIDLSGSAAVFDLPDGRIALKIHGFMPENGAQRHEHTDRVPYIAWAKGGYCTLTPGDVTDNSYVYNWICAGEREHGWEVAEVDYDGHNATDLAIRMNEDRNRDDFCVEVAQTCAGQNLAVKTFRELLLQERVAEQAAQGRHRADRPGGRGHERPGQGAGEAERQA